MGKLIGLLLSVAAIFTMIAGAIYGYVANIISLVSNNESLGMLIGRVIGIFVAPIGILLGYF